MIFGQDFNPDDETVRIEDSTLSLLPEPRGEISLRAGMRLGAYSLRSFLGRGGFGEVWEVEDIRSGRRLALKVLTQIRASSREMMVRFKREGQLAASINHQRSVFVFGAEEIQGYPVIAMELLSGGTLQDQLRLRARLPVKQAVDFTLEIIEGLEAARTAGVVHRDVKPSNCFIDEYGHAKIGDFGISKTLEAQDGFTGPEKFIGTPVFASPEQIRGRDVDFRTDIYSVGATLYCILTGRPPFEGQNAGELLARILSEEPVSFAERSVHLPRGLDRVILRCMAKEREKRYASYAELREDLLPFSSTHALSTGDMAMRLAAFAIDEAVILLGLSGAANALLPAWPAAAADSFLHFLYYGLFETLWRRTPGKHAMGLRVAAASGAPLAARQVLLRTLVFGSIMLPGILLELKAGGAPLVGLATIAVYLATMRRENGFAGPHELVSRTRVIAVRQGDVPVAQLLQSDEWLRLRDEAQPRKFGPYRALRNIWESESEALVLAFDDVLKRNVWIHAMAGERSQPLNRMIAVRPGRLRWLQGDRNGSVHWDAYETPQGTNFVEWVRSRRGLPWSEARTILLGIVEELEARLDAETPVNLSLCHIWVDLRGRAKVFDFPAVLDDEPLAAWSLDNQNAKVFVQQILRFALTGNAAAGYSPMNTAPSVPLPEHARLFVERLWNSGTAFLPLSKIRSELRRVLDLPAEIGRISKAKMAVAVAVLPMLLLAAQTLGPIVDAIRTPEWQRELRRVPVYDDALKQLDAYRSIPAMRSEVEAPCKLMAWVHRETLGAPGGPARFSQLRSFERDRMTACDRTFPSLTQEELEEARAIVAKHLAPSQATFVVRLERSADRILRTGSLFWPIPVLLSFLFPPGAMARKFGFALQTTTGLSAGPLRCAARAFLAWLPFVLYLPAVITGNFGRPGPSWALELLCGGLAVTGLAYSVARPQRGLPDLFAGTYLVPK